ncbi:30S ribosomal protein S6 [Candidatus Desulfarcum epimagneticum]|uniref:Small ribosomal subunit protein bS6 n=1 Tax=uncultured Desulfobacteraceae bacterium TaxID=218296 RepID=A0A484HD87_9BACT|nr:30S ribosomal protein S6 [uncultured Desulfobacteraceae bacterium]
MRRYETIIIIDPDIDAQEQSAATERLEGLIPDHGGFLVKTDRWGSRKLAYEIRKKTTGLYTLIDYCGTSELVNEMERFCKIDERIMKYITVLTDKEPDVDAIKEDMEREKEEKEKKEAEAAEAKAKASEPKPAPVEDEVEKKDAPPPGDEADKPEETAAEEKGE